MAKSNEGLVLVHRQVTRNVRGKVSSFIQKFYIKPNEAKESKKRAQVKTAEMHKDKGGNYNQDRIDKVHEKILSDIVSSCPKAPKGSQPEVVLLLGGAASGKSTVVKSHILPNTDRKYGILNVDDIKEELPEFGEYLKEDITTAADRVHTESSELGQMAIEQITNEGRDFIYDATLSDPVKAKKLVERLIERGYKIKLVGVSIDAEDSLSRAKARAFGNKKLKSSGSGRLIPEKIQLDGHKGASETFEQLKGHKGISNVDLFDNNVKRGEKPIHVVKNGKTVHEGLYNDFKAKRNIDIDGILKKSIIYSSVMEYLENNLVKGVDPFNDGNFSPTLSVITDQLMSEKYHIDEMFGEVDILEKSLDVVIDGIEKGYTNQENNLSRISFNLENRKNSIQREMVGLTSIVDKFIVQYNSDKAFLDLNK